MGPKNFEFVRFWNWSEGIMMGQRGFIRLLGGRGKEEENRLERTREEAMPVFLIFLLLLEVER